MAGIIQIGRDLLKERQIILKNFFSCASAKLCKVDSGIVGAQVLFWQAKTERESFTSS